VLEQQPGIIAIRAGLDAAVVDLGLRVGKPLVEDDAIDQRALEGFDVVDRRLFVTQPR
jgi:hypothetical protein